MNIRYMVLLVSTHEETIVSLPAVASTTTPLFLLREQAEKHKEYLSLRNPANEYKVALVVF